MSIGERKVFIGGLIHSTTSQMLTNYFQKFGPIEEANIITDKHTGNSKGYGFVTFYDIACAAASVKDPSPLINGKIANCNLSMKPMPENDSNKRNANQINSGRIGGQIGRSNSRDGDRGWGDKRSRPNPGRAPNYLQRLRNEGHVITKELAIEKIELDRTTNPADAFKYFLEVSDLFRGSIEFGYYATLLLKQARHYRSTGEVLVEDDHSKRQAQEQSRVDMIKAEGEQQNGQNAEADQTAHFQQFQQQAHDEHEQDYHENQGDGQHYDENQGQEMEQDYDNNNNQYQNEQNHEQQQYDENNNYNNDQQQQEHDQEEVQNENQS
jgi:RNA recognition motif-containing protein